MCEGGVAAAGVEPAPLGVDEGSGGDLQGALRETGAARVRRGGGGALEERGAEGEEGGVACAFDELL